MKPHRLMLSVFTALVLLASPGFAAPELSQPQKATEPKAASQQPISSPSSQQAISPYVVAGGGGSSSAGSFQLTGTIGQPAADLSAGGSFSIKSGFWTASENDVTATKKRRGQLTSQ